ncbi:hypothetical protein EKN56_03220 [Limnobaculum zhutongyuii]|uniref:Uncharacterized protein n=1 Tax=Limnobaculum zhutongyuii TaxID=2498113 RepID=A0A411WH09_9GAMM|nr:hypothetical protein [Limnobaculum zhutongyuii]QBH95503.1 hypothetical protein EKN56_03220 [Limnobaculum zhutongyuii]TQS88808.1 hypothetical protein ELQ32_09375 [Limnobaculum zhutongyuii]
MKNDGFSAYLRLSAQRALLGNVTSNMRSVFVTITNKNMQLFFYFDGEFTELDKEIASYVETEIIADFDDDFTIKTYVERLDFPESIKIINNGWCIYLRKEN